MKADIHIGGGGKDTGLFTYTYVHTVYIYKPPPAGYLPTCGCPLHLFLW